ncbi:Serine protease [Phytophthora megakarya]|uniref:Serine protease n=1 Tax=Phytophthora megakarya TaxID=4795 RepID=A0A225W0D1_9STRA|nr:Serine protease [Phytophthora megakarya]
MLMGSYIWLGCKVTPQQTRTLLRSIMGHDSVKDHMKNMLHALRQLDGSGVLVIQDQFDVTCGVVMQTKIQKMMFERWGETLAMDFTHGTNNLGYHLGASATATFL